MFVRAAVDRPRAHRHIPGGAIVFLSVLVIVLIPYISIIPFIWYKTPIALLYVKLFPCATSLPPLMVAYLFINYNFSKGHEPAPLVGEGVPRRHVAAARTIQVL